MKKTYIISESQYERILSEQGANWTFTKMSLNSPSGELKKQLVGKTVSIFKVTHKDKPIITFKVSSTLASGDYGLEDILLFGDGQIFPPKGMTPVTNLSKDNNISLSVKWFCEYGGGLSNLRYKYKNGYTPGKEYTDYGVGLDFDLNTLKLLRSFCKKYPV